MSSHCGRSSGSWHNATRVMAICCCMALLKAQGLVVNRKRIYRIYREEGLQVRVRKRKKADPGAGRTGGAPTG